MATTSRAERVADLIQKTLSEQLQREVADPRLAMVTFSEVKVSRDLAHAKVYFSTFGAQDQVESVTQALRKAAPYLRRLVAKNCELRIVPELHFLYDDTLNTARQMSDLIDAALKKGQS